MAGEPAVMMVMATSCGVHIPAGSRNGMGEDAGGWVSSLLVGLSKLGLLSGAPHGSVAGPSGDVWAGIAGDVGRSLRGSGVR